MSVWVVFYRLHLAGPYLYQNLGCVLVVCMLFPVLLVFSFLVNYDWWDQVSGCKLYFLHMKSVLLWWGLFVVYYRIYHFVVFTKCTDKKFGNRCFNFKYWDALKICCDFICRFHSCRNQSLTTVGQPILEKTSICVHYADSIWIF